MVLQRALFHSFFVANIPLCTCTTSVHSRVSWHFGCFHFLATVNLAAVDVWVIVSFRFWSSRLIGPVVGRPDHMVAQFLPFNGTSIRFSLVAATSIHPTNSIEGMHFSTTPSAFIVDFLLIAVLTGVRWYLFVVWICMSPIIHYVDHFSMSFFFLIKKRVNFTLWNFLLENLPRVEFFCQFQTVRHFWRAGVIYSRAVPCEC